ncbi:DsbA family protein [Daejeonella lutea]|uniref:Thioredoxin n=1 Tax=Daejeonella lutea TaxID=572036 RepID=A0A1T5DFX6_9SPHI|nr:thioredoxin domain-containing protein [Daejeonella lutea]SKB70648.1 Thioredoxin [Daejeonella lutea]
MALRQAVSENDHIQGNSQAPIELVEYGDYECPHCGRAYPILKEMQNQLGSNLKFVFRNFPLSKIHPHAKSAAIAAEAASHQNKFWEMHDILFENQRRLTSTAVREYAQKIQLDMSKFENDILDSSIAEKIDAEFYSGMRSGVNATPTFFINGEKYDGTPADLQVFIETTFL